MKKNIILSFLLTFLTTSISNGQVEDNLNISGDITIRDTEIPIKGAKIEIFENNSTQKQVFYSNDSGQYSLQIPIHKNLVYKIKVSHPKFVFKIFEINTKNIASQISKVPPIYASIALFKPEPTINYDLLELPLIRYSFNPEKKHFEYDEVYFESMLTALENFKRFEEKVKQEQIQNEIIIKQNAAREIAEKETSAQKAITNIAILGIVVLLALLFFIIRSLKRNIQQKRVISEKHMEIEKQKHLIEEKQKEIIDSIKYARRIQGALLPTEKHINNCLQKLNNK